MNTSLEADIASFDAVQSLSVSDSSRIQKLTRSISVNEVAMASLKGEFDKQNSELLVAEGELKKLQNALAKKVSDGPKLLVFSLLSSYFTARMNS